MVFVILSILAVLIVVIDLFTDLSISPINELIFFFAYIFCCALEIRSAIMKHKIKKDKK